MDRKRSIDIVPLKLQSALFVGGLCLLSHDRERRKRSANTLVNEQMAQGVLARSICVEQTDGGARPSTPFYGGRNSIVGAVNPSATEFHVGRALSRPTVTKTECDFYKTSLFTYRGSHKLSILVRVGLV